MRVREAVLLSHKAQDRNGGDHGFLLKLDLRGDVVIPPGFASGYGGEGPRGLSYALGLFESFGVQVDEVFIDDEIHERLELMQLTASDLATIEKAKRRSVYQADYLSERDYEDAEKGRLWLRRVDPIIPLALIAPPLADLVPGFAANPDHALLTGYRRLEDAVRAASDLTETKRLMSAAFLGPNAPLGWPEIDSGAQEGRAQLFVATYMAFRNQRAHREQTRASFTNDVREFLLLNLLFDLLGSATRKEPQPETPGDTPGVQRSSSVR